MHSFRLFFYLFRCYFEENKIFCTWCFFWPFFSAIFVISYFVLYLTTNEREMSWENERNCNNSVKTGREGKERGGERSEEYKNESENAKIWRDKSVKTLMAIFFVLLNYRLDNWASVFCLINLLQSACIFFCLDIFIWVSG